jgi:bifunctional non-homologous end joining protein LigD
MLATPGDVPEGPEWLYEVEWDGVRVLADVADGRVRLLDGEGHDVSRQFPELAGLTHLAPDVLLDGEVVLLEDGVPRSAALADRTHGPVDPRAARAAPVTYMVFDVLRLYGVPLLERPFAERRATLERLDLPAAAHLSLSPAYTDGRALLEATLQQGMEGVVAKRRDGVYRPGERSPDWVRATHRTRLACVVGGWLPERASAARGGGGRIAALLLGVPDGDGLRYAGLVSSGLAGTATQLALHQRLAPAAAPPFTGRLPRADSAGARWCAPGLVVEVSHTGWTGAGRLERPVFRAVRDDLVPGRVLSPR